jgi:hypothetical protein
MTIEYCLAAEFDIDKGSSLSFQYPPNSTAENPAYGKSLIQGISRADVTRRIPSARIRLYHFYFEQEISMFSSCSIEATFFVMLNDVN